MAQRTDLWKHGTSTWESLYNLKSAGFIEKGGLTFGSMWAFDDERVSDKKRFNAVTYNGDRHLLTVAPTRTGKGTTAIVPALLDHKGALLCIDPKGENAFITAEARENIHGQGVHILDPWGEATGQLEREAAQFNPLDMLTPDSPNLADDALMIADALIVTERGDHWGNEAQAMVMGFIIHLVTSEKEKGQRNLGRLREILSLPPTELQNLVIDMAKDGCDLARSAANRFMQKSERELSSVISTAQQNTHFLESPLVKKSLEKSSFDFADLKSDDAPISVYLVLPADRLNTHGRWLRLIVSMAITAMVRGGNKPKKSALFLLDEFAALGKLAVVEQAYGLMAGFGMQIWAIIQDLSQLQDLYDRRWQTFLGNAGVLQIFGTRDIMTAEYVSKLAGTRTVEEISKATGDKREGGFLRFADPEYTGMQDRSYGRLLIQPEEVIRLPEYWQLLFFPSMNPIGCQKVEYYKNAKYFNAGGKAIFRQLPHFPEPTEFYVWDRKTARIIARNTDEKHAKKTKKQAKKKAERAAVNAKARAETMEKAGNMSKSAMNKAGKFARFMGEKLTEGQQKIAEATEKNKKDNDSSD